jgi:hypothetical protein
MLDEGRPGFRGFSSEGNGDEIGEGIMGKFADLAGHAERARAVDRGHLEDFFRQKRWLSAGEGAHFLEEAELDDLPALAIDAGEAVGAETDIDARGGEFAKWNLRCLK